MDPGRLVCAGCGRTGGARDVATGWAMSTPLRPTGATSAREPGPLTALCPSCARERVRDLEARLDP
ncbi:hypothetical protein [Geodermatophilus sabuli]|uniref:hypothetical protein n=1 Tax=Geodermatophilus sabuli TaxID=1564158 RepID=UPI000BE295E1|nr:hypothetical protein [Geodermatophilus sabuli]MBB3086043.1 hypothetical protein [Geodermatophilus sabuli]